MVVEYFPTPPDTGPIWPGPIWLVSIRRRTDTDLTWSDQVDTPSAHERREAWGQQVPPGASQPTSACPDGSRDGDRRNFPTRLPR